MRHYLAGVLEDLLIAYVWTETLCGWRMTRRALRWARAWWKSTEPYSPVLTHYGKARAPIVNDIATARKRRAAR